MFQYIGRLMEYRKICASVSLLLLLVSFLGKNSNGQNSNPISVEDVLFDGRFSQKVKKTVVFGKLSNASAEELSKIQISYDQVVPTRELQIKKTVPVLANGEFRIELDYPFPYQQLWLSVGDYFFSSIYANEGLEIRLDFEKLRRNHVAFLGEGIEFKGEDGLLNNLMNRYILFKRDEQLKLLETGQLLMASRDLINSEYLNKANSYNAQLETLENEFLQQNPLFQSFGWILKNERLSRIYGEMCAHFWGAKMDDSLWHKVVSHKSFVMSNEGTIFYRYQFDYLKSLPPNILKPDWKELSAVSRLSSEDKALLRTLIDEDTRAENGLAYGAKLKDSLSKKAYDRFSSEIEIIRATKLAERIDNEYSQSRADLIKMNLVTEDPILQKAITNFLMQTMKTNWCKKVIADRGKTTADQVNSITTLLAGSKTFTSRYTFGTPILEAKLYKIDKMTVNDLLIGLRNMFPEKAVIIDLWATWCSPCISEMPFAKELYSETKSLPVEFVYLCTSNGSTLQIWKNSIARLQQPGTHIFLDEKIGNELMSNFSLSGYPSHIFISRTGDYIPGALNSYSHTSLLEIKSLIKR